MGLFCLNNEKEKTVEGCIHTAMKNLNLLEDHPGCDYLIAFARNNLKDALTALYEDSLFRKENSKSWV